MKKLISFIIIFLAAAHISYAQINPPYPFIDTGTEIVLRNSGSRTVRFNTNFLVNQTGGIEESDVTGLKLKPYSALAGATTELRFYELNANGTDYVSFKSPDSVLGPIVFTLPESDSAGTQCLASNGAGVLSWAPCTGTAGPPGPAASGLGYINVKDAPYSATGDGVTDDTVAIQTALDQLTGGIYIPAGEYVISQLVVPPGQSIIGAGMVSPPHEGTVLRQKNGVNVSAIVGSVCTNPLEYWHWSQISNFQIRKAVGSTDTLGSGIEVACRSGEGLKFDRLIIVEMPESGIYYKRGGAPTLISDVHVFRSGHSGIRLERLSADIWQTVDLKHISGDSNTVALIYVKTAGATNENFHFSDIKAETTGPAPFRQPSVIVLDNLLGTPVYVENVSATVSGGGFLSEIVKIITSTTRVYMVGARCASCTNLVNDVVNSVLVPVTGNANLTWLAYHNSRVAKRESTGMTEVAIALGQNASLPTTVGTLFQTAGANNVTLHTLKRQTDTSPTGLFANYTNTSNTSLWQVDITGNSTQQGEHRFLELAVNGTNYVGFKAADTVGSNVIWTLPATDSTGTQCLASNGAGVLAWAACSGGGGLTIGGSTTQVQFNAAGALSGDVGFTYTVGSATATITNLVLTNPLLPASGGSGLATATANGVLYGNGTSAFGITAQGAANSVLIANAGAPSFSQQPTLNTGIITKGQVAVRLDPHGASAGNTGELRFLELAAGGTNYAAFKAADAMAASLTWTLPIVDSTGSQCLSSNGSGVLSWSNCGTSIGGSNTQVQFNASGLFAGDAGFTYNSATDTATLGALVLTSPLAVTSGGTGRATLTDNGVLYGNGTGILDITAQGGANTVLIANNGAPSFSNNPSLAVGIKTFGQNAVEINPFDVAAGETGEIRFLELTANGTHYVGFKAPDALAGTLTFTLPATDSTGTQCLSSNGSGTLAWSACSAGVGTPGGADTEIQYNSAGTFAASPKMTFNGTTTTIETLTVSNTFTVDGSTFKVNHSTNTVALGVAGSQTALLSLSGATSGTVTLTTAAAAGTYTLTLPTTDGFSNQVLTTDGSGVLTWSDSATATNVLTLINKRITPRMVSMADGTTITPTSDSADKNFHTNTQAAGTLTVAAPTGTPTNGQCIWLRIKSTNSHSFVFNAIYRGSTDNPLPTTVTGSGKTDYLLICYNSADTKWDYVAKNFGF